MTIRSFDKVLMQTDFEYFDIFRKADLDFQDLLRMKFAAKKSLSERLLSIRTDTAMFKVVSNVTSVPIENSIMYSREGRYSCVLIRVQKLRVSLLTANLMDSIQNGSVQESIDDLNSGRKSFTVFYPERIAESVATGKGQLESLGSLMGEKGFIV